MQRVMGYANEAASETAEYLNLSFSREGVLSRFWLQTYKEQQEPREKATREKAEVSRFGTKSRVWATIVSVIRSSFRPR